MPIDEFADFALEDGQQALLWDFDLKRYVQVARPMSAEPRRLPLGVFGFVAMAPAFLAACTGGPH